ncbi:MAG: carboxypeptidase regulatory-like domain-containing protein, partial [Bryobacteraceae bacterium]
GNYTWGRSLDTASFLTDLDGINVVNPFNVGAYRGLSDFSVAHRFVMNYLWIMPSPKGPLRHVLGGWESSGIWNWQHGFPINITSGDDTSLTAIGNDQADVVSSPTYTSGSRGAKISQWFSTNSFRVAKLGTFGNVGRNTLYGPGTFNIDFSMHKSIPITEKLKLQYRAEFFNVMNHPILGNPGTTVTSGGFGRITSAGAPRVIQMALKLNF